MFIQGRALASEAHFKLVLTTKISDAHGGHEEEAPALHTPSSPVGRRALTKHCRVTAEGTLQGDSVTDRLAAILALQRTGYSVAYLQAG